MMKSNRTRRPAVRFPVKETAQRRISDGDLGPISGRRYAGQGLVRPLFVVADEPQGGDLTHLLSRFKDLGVEDFRSIRPMNGSLSLVLSLLGTS